MRVDLDVQPALFPPGPDHPVFCELTLTLADGAFSLGASVRSLSTLELLAHTTTLRPEGQDMRSLATAYLEALLRAAEELQAPSPFA